MSCHHGKGDPNCSKNGGGYAAEQASANARRVRELEAELASGTPDATNYDIEKVEIVGAHVVVQVKYPNCKRCAFEGTKVMVFLNTAPIDMLRWRRIDPHFRAPDKKSPTEAPSPAARFPGTPAGWADAVAYARGKK